MADWLWLIPGFPLLGALINAGFGQWLGVPMVKRLAALMPLLSSVVILVIWLEHATHPELVDRVWTWMAVGSFVAEIGLRIDAVSLVMVSIAAFVGFLIHLYSQQFLAGDYGERRYYFYLNLFVGGMLVLTMADNLLLLYLGWETVGLCSYALVAHWYRQKKNAWAGRKAFVVTRIGDTTFAIGIFLLFAQYHTLDIHRLLQMISGQPVPSVLLAASVLVLIGALAKSAQFPLHLWLPDSMAGPSTVSALIHAATMVTAGVYLSIRLLPLFAAVPGMLWVIAFLGAWTAFFAASCGLAQVDIKRVLAYSTISQLGYMFLAVGIGAPALGLFHLLVHACFKALLFMAAGAVISIYAEDHDIRHMGGLKNQQPLLRWTFLAGISALAAVPLISAGFYSKDAIIDASWLAPHGALLYALALAAALMTAAYAFRLYFLVFEGEPRVGEPYQLGWGMKIPLLILAVASIGIGWLQFPPGWPGPHLWLPWLRAELGPTPEPSGNLALVLETVGAAVTLVGIWLGYLAARWERQGRGLSRIGFLAHAWYVDALALRFLPPVVYGGARFLRLGVEHLLFRSGILGGIREGLQWGGVGLVWGENGLVSRYVAFMGFGLLLLLLLLWGGL
ncbi:MAG: NADH-quinone oxidoreductase subunit L [Acidithiobacillus sp.]|uniref:NADH-quinone oxidoreductase subunit L n=1 Tax=Acidithiobacillus sp. TaxID=1872118 RepID=UPI003CFEA4E0